MAGSDLGDAVWDAYQAGKIDISDIMADLAAGKIDAQAAADMCAQRYWDACDAGKIAAAARLHDGECRTDAPELGCILCGAAVYSAAATVAAKSRAEAEADARITNAEADALWPPDTRAEATQRRRERKALAAAYAPTRDEDDYVRLFGTWPVGD